MGEDLGARSAACRANVVSALAAERPAYPQVEKLKYDNRRHDRHPVLETDAQEVRVSDQPLESPFGHDTPANLRAISPAGF